MSKILLIGAIVVGAGLVITGAVTGIPRYITFGIVIAVAGWWIYLLWMIRKKKTKIFHEQIESKLTERRLKMLKTFVLVAGISLAVGIVGVIVHNVIYGLSEIEEPVAFSIGIAGLLMFVIATIGSLIIFIIGRRKPARRKTETSTT